MRIVLLVGIVGLLVGGGAAIYSYLPHRELRDNFDFHGEEITTARTAAVVELRNQLDAFERRAGLDHVGARERSDRCSPGQDNFTRQDEYAYICVLEIAQLVPVVEPFYSNASRLAEALVEGDCPDGTTAKEELAKHLAAPEELNETDGDCYDFTLVGWPFLGGWVKADATPDELGLARFNLPSTCGALERGLCEESRLDLRAALAAAPPGTAYLAIVTARSDYYRVPW